jgi:hypothetical protein
MKTYMLSARLISYTSQYVFQDEKCFKQNWQRELKRHLTPLQTFPVGLMVFDILCMN